LKSRYLGYVTWKFLQCWSSRQVRVVISQCRLHGILEHQRSVCHVKNSYWCTMELWWKRDN
jgi:hypothetical protein